MPEMIPFLKLKGALNIILDDNPIKIECEGQYVKLTFTSYYGLKRFILCNKSLNKTIPSNGIQEFFKKLKLSYYIKDVLIGESNHNIPPSLLGKYIGLENTRVYLKNIIKYFFTF